MVDGRPFIVFDMDGVLVDVSDSYRECIRATVKHFTELEITPELIQDYKNAGGWNNDWALSQKIMQDLGHPFEYDVVVDYFQQIFFGEANDGFIARERWIADGPLLERLATNYRLGIFTGRLADEAAITLRRFIPDVRFDLIVAEGDVPNSKPAPDGLLLFRRNFPGAAIWYIGDTVDDARSARAAGVKFVGIADRRNPRYEALVGLLRSEGALAVLDDINQLESVLSQQGANA